MADSRPLAGRTVVTTRDRPGQLDERLTDLGATVVHMPLIEIVDVDDPAPLLAARRDIAGFDWVVVTSRHGAARVVDAVAVARSQPLLAAVGTATAAALTERLGRKVDLVPDRQTAEHLVAAFADRVHSVERILIAQADRAGPTLADGLRAAGHDVTVVTAYHTRLRRPSVEQAERALAADAVAFASGSSALSWAEAVGRATPPVVCAIGPTTAAAARHAGIGVTHEADDHSIDGLVATVVEALAEPSRGQTPS